jgi:GNAT superfamily N-acetyltransferase
MPLTHGIEENYPSVLVIALGERIAQFQTVGNPFGFELLARDPSTAVLARNWQVEPNQVPFSRVFNYVAPAVGSEDTFLEAVLTAEPNLVVETNPGQTDTETHLWTRGLREVWRIPWMHTPLNPTLAEIPPNVKRVPTGRLAGFSDVLARGYGYQGIQQNQWQNFFERGFASDNFHCFWVMSGNVSVACGVVFIAGRFALVDGASTLEAHRGKGLQKDLLRARLAFARQQGCEYAFSRTARGSVSQANLEAVGMSLAWESKAWRKP